MYLKLDKEGRFGYLYIENTIFSYNIANQYGGALLIDSTDLELFKSEFKFNKAQIGGAIRYLNCKPQFVFDLQNQENLKEILFEDNQASIYGQDFTSVPFYLEYMILESDDNNDDDFIVDKIDSEQHVFQFGSGHSLQIQIIILDEHKEEILFQNIIGNSVDIEREFENYLVQLIVKKNSIYLENNLIFIKADQNSLIFKNVIVTGIPLTHQVFYIQAPFLHTLEQSNQIINVLKEYPINIHFRNCKQGEFYLQSDLRIKCIVCQNNTYSLVEIPPDKIINDTIQCKPCPDSADQCYGNIIEVKQGYWRISNNSDDIIYCEDNPSNCVGYSDYKNGTYCKEGYIGPLCEQCDTSGKFWQKRYTFISEYECQECDVFNAYVRQILILLGITIYIFISLNLAHRIYKKLAIVYYLRMMNIISFGNSVLTYVINDIELDLPYQIDMTSELLGNPVGTFTFTIDCIFPADMKIPQVYVWALVSTIIPIIFYLFILIIQVLICIVKNKQLKLNYLRMNIIFIIFFFQPSVCDNNKLISQL
ncbi:transmembrane protein, putative (macronuclear) [Tetrahymena thermophila SB210]|uniref:Transmembrane protein, putative n=1 Tax=Tetrahymena thermophila (strain SB210) TaxID=312017 RepID=W7XCU6_TETTS|nr:transmembrane protein, putative [Tetrahymena thermophila SB210]EWS74388.1 transmembrane protein, putative [Tetrahymena thermophila SB210]|eukprot:XP_012653065.1 transmembrane protein, putative [Tetrahymena thermophila SB210]